MKKTASGLFLLVLLISHPLEAADFHLTTDLLGQTRRNEKDQMETPLNGYFGLAFGRPKFSGETNMRFVEDASRRQNDYDLYQAILHFQPAEAMQVHFGRQFVNQGFSAETLDGLKINLTPSGPINLTLYSGIPRSVEIGDFNQNDGLLSGLTLGLKEVPGTNAQVHFAWRKNNIHQNNFGKNDDLLAGLNLSHQWSVATKPMLYSSAEYDTTGKLLQSATTGLDLTPHRRLNLNMEFDYFDINRNSTRPTIISLFARGPVYSGRFSSRWTLVADKLDFVESYSYQNVEIQKDLRRNGHLLQSSLQFSFESIGLNLEPAYYFGQSFGGDIHGGRLSAHEQFTERFYAEVSTDYSDYRKVTNDNDTASSTMLWTGYEVAKGWTISGGFEYNKNNFFNEDVRGTFLIRYLFDHGS